MNKKLLLSLSLWAVLAPQHALGVTLNKKNLVIWGSIAIAGAGLAYWAYSSYNAQSEKSQEKTLLEKDLDDIIEDVLNKDEMYQKYKQSKMSPTQAMRKMFNTRDFFLNLSATDEWDIFKDYKNTDDKTPLHYAAQHKNPNVLNFVQKLFSSKTCFNFIDATFNTLDFTINIKDASGNTPLHWAVRAKRTENVKLLLEAGAKSYIKNNHGQTPLEIARTIDNQEIIQLLKNK